MGERKPIDEFQGNVYAVWVKATQERPDRFFGPWVAVDESDDAETAAWACAQECSMILQRQGHATNVVYLAPYDLLPT
jgi:hypothetical protein